MNCLRCGRETQDNHVFCDSCQETMRKYPVRPGTAVVLPRRKETAAVRKPRKHTVPDPQKQIRRLKRQKRILWFFIILLLLSLAAAAAGLFYVMYDQTPKPGQNYVVVETTAVP